MQPGHEAERAAALIDAMTPDLETEGFQVFFQPQSWLLPPFMRAYRPDAIAVRPDKKIAIEVVSAGMSGKPAQLIELFNSHPEWELRVIVAAGRDDRPSVGVVSRQTLADNLDQLPGILDRAGPVAALLTAWAVLEAAARSVLPGHPDRPEPSGKLVERLASLGYVTPDEADQLRSLAAKRNAAAHGQLDIALSTQELGGIIATTRSLLLDEGAAAPT